MSIHGEVKAGLRVIADSTIRPELRTFASESILYLVRIENILADYDAALKRREHGDVAAHKAVQVLRRLISPSNNLPASSPS